MMFRKTPYLFAICLFLALHVASHSVNAQWWRWWNQPEEKNLLDTLKDDRRYSTLVAAIEAAGLTNALVGEGELTIFAPMNSAFEQLPEGTLESFLQDPGALRNLLYYHIVAGSVQSGDLENGDVETLLDGESVSIKVQSFGWWWTQLRVNNAMVVSADNDATNGVIHGINEVLMPGYLRTPNIMGVLEADPDRFSTITSLLESSGYARALDRDVGRFTLLAPTNEAFGAVPQETLDSLANDASALRTVLRNHLFGDALLSTDLENEAILTSYARNELFVEIDGNAIAIGGAPVVAADLVATNGVVHGINAVLLPELPKSLLTIASDTDDLSTFATAASVSGLADRLDSTRSYPNYTIFAPNNAAFDAIDPATLGALFAEPAGALTDILKLHVVGRKYSSADLYDGQRLRTLSRDRVEVSISEEGGVMINGAKVISVDIPAVNGVIHIIDSVLQDTPFTVADYIAENRSLTTLNSALKATSLAGALDGEESVTLFAPTDRAFKALPEGTLEALLEDTVSLSNILLYHVVAGAQDADALVDAAEIVTLNGQSVSVTSESYRSWWWRNWTITRVNEALVIRSKSVDNGIIHVVDTVLLPGDNEDDVGVE